MYHTHKNPLKKVTRESETVEIVKSGKQRKLHKAFLRYHDPKNWAMLREALKAMGREDLIGHGAGCLIPPYNAKLEGEANTHSSYQSARRKNSSASGDSIKRTQGATNSGKHSVGNSKAVKSGSNKTKAGIHTPAQSKSRQPSKGNFQTQHTGLPPRKSR